MVFAILSLWAPLAGQETDRVGLIAWGASLPMDQRIGLELQRFGGARSLDQGYVRAFPQEVRFRIFSSADARVTELLSGQCSPFVNVSIGGSEFGDLPHDSPGEEIRRRSEDFEGSLIRTEMVACLETDLSDPEKVLEIYTSPEFRMAADSRIESMWDGPEGSCFETKGVHGLVDPTRGCNRIEDFRGEGVAAQHSQVVFNEGVRPYQPVFFKESLKTFVRLSGGMALHYINYTRASGLSRLARWVAAGQIRGSQEKNVEELNRWLARQFLRDDVPSRKSLISPSGREANPLHRTVRRGLQAALVS